MLKYRLITAIILIPLVILALFMLPPAAFGFVVIAVCGLGGWEWAQFAGLFGAGQRIVTGLVFAAGLAAWQLTLDMNYLTADFAVTGSLWVALVWWICAVLLVVTFPKSAALWKNSVVIRLLFGVVTIVPFYSGMMVLRTQGYAGGDIYQGSWWLLYVMLLVWAADSGAYAFGRLMGKHKMAPRVSPGKTLEGLAGGLITAGLVSWLFSHYSPLHNLPEYLIPVSVIVVLISVFGDLTESMFKRQSGVKDSSQLIPGHGGVMDRIDSLTAAVPVFAGLILLVFSGF
ncbi:MAG: phosphatidate cytidylyltransferase [Morganella sp. (in: enterobacteria)]